MGKKSETGALGAAVSRVLSPAKILAPQSLVRRFSPILTHHAGSTPIAFPALWRHGAIARPLPESLGRIGSLEVRLAQTPGEVRAAQALRYHVFYEEMAAIADAATLAARRDRDAFDAICDHLLVLDHDELTPRGSVSLSLASSAPTASSARRWRAPTAASTPPASSTSRP